MHQLTVQKLKEWKDSNTDYQLIDIREEHEVDDLSMGGEHIPMGEIMGKLDRISKIKPVVVHCRIGSRSTAVCNALSVAGFDNIYDLQGGISEWVRSIEPSLGKK